MNFMALFVSVFFSCSCINTVILVIDFVSLEDLEREERVQNSLMLLQSLLFLWLQLITLKMYWRFSNPLQHKILF